MFKINLPEFLPHVEEAVNEMEHVKISTEKVCGCDIFRSYGLDILTKCIEKVNSLVSPNIACLFKKEKFMLEAEKRDFLPMKPKI